MKTKTSFWPKVGLLFLFYWSILLWEACGSTVVDSCGNNGCPTVEFPFFDYEDVVLTENDLALGPDEPLFLSIYPTQLEYVACQLPQRRIGLLSAAYACSCLGDGAQGDKYPISSINIYTDKPFLEGGEAMDSLNEFFSVVAEDENGTKTLPLNEVSADNNVRMLNQVTIQSSIRPFDAAVPYVLTIELLKANGNLITINTEAITWE